MKRNTYLSGVQLLRPRQRIRRIRMNRRQPLLHKRDRSVLILIQPQRSNEPSTLVHRLDLDLHVPLHVPSGGKFGSFRTVWLTLLRRISTCPRSSDAWLPHHRLTTIARAENWTQMTYHRERA